MKEKDSFMSDENNSGTPLPETIEYNIHVDRRRRAKQRLLTSPFIESNNFSGRQLHGKVHQVQFKITPFAEKVGREVAALFNMSLSQYTKAVLYHNLGLVFEPVDRRRKKRK